MAVKDVARVAGMVLLAPLGLALGLVLLALWLAFTVSGIGPLAHYLLSRRDRAVLAACCNASLGGVVSMVTVPGKTRRLAVRWSPGTDPGLPPVAIPNGLGATLVTIAGLHDLLERKGYPVLSYDRAGVGLSDPLPPEQAAHATPAAVVADMKAVLDAHVPSGGRRAWVLVGPSMGSVAAQAFMAEHPDDLAAFVNVDGVPYPFAGKRTKFLQAAWVYRLVACVVWTGVLRPLLALASGELRKLTSAHFPLAVVRAQMNEANFFASLAREMTTMMDLTAAATAAWGGAFDIAAMRPQDRDVLVNAEPAACGDVTPSGGWEGLPRAAVELGDAWVPRAEAEDLVKRLLKEAAAEGGAQLQPLPRLFPRLPVRAMSARNYDFGAASGFYDSEMKAYAAAEHNLHVLLARDGRRTVFPTRSHNDMFFTLLPFIATQVDEVVAALDPTPAAPDRL